MSFRKSSLIFVPFHRDMAVAYYFYEPFFLATAFRNGNNKIASNGPSGGKFLSFLFSAAAGWIHRVTAYDSLSSVSLSGVTAGCSLRIFWATRKKSEEKSPQKNARATAG